MKSCIRLYSLQYNRHLFHTFLIWGKRWKISALRMNSGYSKVRGRKLRPFSWSIIIPEIVSKYAKVGKKMISSSCFILCWFWVKSQQILQFSNIVVVWLRRFYKTGKYNLCYDDIVHLKQHIAITGRWHSALAWPGIGLNHFVCLPSTLSQEHASRTHQRQHLLPGHKLISSLVYMVKWQRRRRDQIRCCWCRWEREEEREAEERPGLVLVRGCRADNHR